MRIHHAGDVVGALSFSVGHGANTLKKVASVRMVHQPYDVQNIRLYPLTRMVGYHTLLRFYQICPSDKLLNFYNVLLLSRSLLQAQQSNVEIMHDGYLSVSTSYFERNTIVNLQKELESENTSTRDIGFWVGLDPEGEWESIRSLLPLSVAPKSLQNEYIGMEVVMKNGKKHVILRGLVAVVNDSDVMLNISTFLASFGHDPSLGTHTSNTVVEEVFQNQYYQLSSGWGNNWPGVHPDNPGHWSTRDFSYSSKVRIFIGFLLSIVNFLTYHTD